MVASGADRSGVVGVSRHHHPQPARCGRAAVAGERLGVDAAEQNVCPALAGDAGAVLGEPGAFGIIRCHHRPVDGRAEDRRDHTVTALV